MTPRDVKHKVKLGELEVRNVPFPPSIKGARLKKLRRDVPVTIEYLTTPGTDIKELVGRFSYAKGRPVSHQWVAQMLSSGLQYLKENGGVVLVKL